MKNSNEIFMTVAMIFIGLFGLVQCQSICIENCIRYARDCKEGDGCRQIAIKCLEACQGQACEKK